MKSDTMKDKLQYVVEKTIIALNIATICHYIFITISGLFFLDLKKTIKSI
jgi:hypothetical protein